MNRRESPAAERVRALLIGMRAGFFTRFGEEKARKILMISAISVGALLILSLIMLLTPVRSIEVTGDIEMFSEGDIVESSGVGEGDLMMLHPSFAIKRAIKNHLPLVGKITVRKSITGKLKINVKVGEVDFYIKHGDKYYAVDKDLRVLDEGNKRSKYSAYGAAYLIIPEVRQPEVGKRLVFYDTVEETDTEGETLYEVKDEQLYDYVSNFLTVMKDDNNELLQSTDGIVLDEKFNVYIVYGMKYQIKFGNTASLDAKFKVLSSIFEEGTAERMEKVVIDLTSPSRATVREAIDLDLTEFDD
jgi:hypothetical protein